VRVRVRVRVKGVECTAVYLWSDLLFDRITQHVLARARATSIDIHHRVVRFVETFFTPPPPITSHHIASPPKPETEMSLNSCSFVTTAVAFDDANRHCSPPRRRNRQHQPKSKSKRGDVDVVVDGDGVGVETVESVRLACARDTSAMRAAFQQSHREQYATHNAEKRALLDASTKRQIVMTRDIDEFTTRHRKSERLVTSLRSQLRRVNDRSERDTAYLLALRQSTVWCRADDSLQTALTAAAAGTASAASAASAAYGDVERELDRVPLPDSATRSPLRSTLTPSLFRRHVRDSGTHSGTHLLRRNAPVRRRGGDDDDADDVVTITNMTPHGVVAFTCVLTVRAFNEYMNGILSTLMTMLQSRGGDDAVDDAVAVDAVSTAHAVADQTFFRAVRTHLCADRYILRDLARLQRRVDDLGRARDVTTAQEQAAREQAREQARDDAADSADSDDESSEYRRRRRHLHDVARSRLRTWASWTWDTDADADAAADAAAAAQRVEAGEAETFAERLDAYRHANHHADTVDVNRAHKSRQDDDDERRASRRRHRRTHKNSAYVDKDDAYDDV
jgi:hypothetical protein